MKKYEVRFEGRNIDKMTTLEDGLVARVRSCWNNPMYRRMFKHVLKDGIRELRNFRRNREINPKLHKKLDKEAVNGYLNGTTFTLNPPTKELWYTFCRNQELLTQNVWEENTKTLEIKGKQVSLFGEVLPDPPSKDTTRQNPPAEKTSLKALQHNLDELSNGKLSPYFRVRETANILSGQVLLSTMYRVRNLAYSRFDDELHSKDFKRIHNLVRRVINELEAKEQETLDLC